MICESLYNFYGRAKTNVSAYTLSRDSIEEFRKVLIDLDDELALFERYSEANGLPVCDYKFFFDDKIKPPSVKERFWQSIRRLLIINEYKRTKKFRLSDMIGKLKTKMEEERRKIEIKKEKEGLFCEEVGDILSKHILQKLQLNSGLVDLFNHAAELDDKSNKVMALLNERDRLIRNLTATLYLLIEDLRSTGYVANDLKKTMMERTQTLVKFRDKEPQPEEISEYDRLQSNLTNVKHSDSNKNEFRATTMNTQVTPEEMMELKDKLISMIKVETDDKPFKKILKKKLAKYEHRLRMRSMKTMKSGKHDGDTERSPSNSSDSGNELKPKLGSKKTNFVKKSTMLKKRKSSRKML